MYRRKRLPGQKEARWSELCTHSIEELDAESDAGEASLPPGEIDELRTEIGELRNELTTLREEFTLFKESFS